MSVRQVAACGGGIPKVLDNPLRPRLLLLAVTQFEEAKELFKKAMAVDEHIVKREAIDDHDLKPLWNSMRWMLWKPSE